MWGFPCQDYSVAKTLDKSKGLEGKKGVLWWEIHRIIKSKLPDFVLLENVDRLLKSPSNQRGRDFAVMLASLDDLGYSLEWRMIDASDYGFLNGEREFSFWHTRVAHLIMMLWRPSHLCNIYNQMEFLRKRFQ